MVGFQDETWWSRVSPPTVSAWTDQDQPLRLLEQTVKPESGGKPESD